MADLPTERPGRALLMIGALYISQGLPIGLAFMALPAIFRKLGFSTETIGMIGIVILPWALKFLWAPFVDRHRAGFLGRRRRWIIPAQILLVLLYIVLAAVAQRDHPFVAIVVLLIAANIISATQDIATDGWTVELLRGPYLGWANGLQIGGFAFGMLIGGGITVAMFDVGGWTYAFGLLALLTCLSIVPVWLMHEAPREAGDAAALAAPSLRATLARSGAWLVISIAATFHFASTMASAMLGPFLVDQGLSLPQVGVVKGTGVACIAICGALAGGLLTRRFGAGQTAVASGFAAALTLGLWAVSAAGGQLSLSAAVAIMFVAGFGGGIAYVAFYTIFMQWASLRQAGTDFTVLQCTESCTNIAASIAAGYLASYAGFTVFFATIMVIALVVMMWIFFALRRLANVASLQSTRADAADGERWKDNYA